MTALAELADRAASTVFMLVAAGLLAWPRDGRGIRVAWITLLAVGLAYDLALDLNPVNFPHANFTHYYLGAKYSAPYRDTYRLFQAGLGRPQIGMRDLDRPQDLVRASRYAQRAYYIDLLRGAQVPFDPLASLDTLAARARDAGVIEAEARRILEASLPTTRIESFRHDIRTAAATGQGPRLTLDYGYNGSPFYGLLRQVDPTLQVPFGRGPALAGLAWQLLGVALIVLLAGAAVGLTMTEQLAAAALILVSQEFANYVLPGLAFTELWVPVLVAVWALRRDRPVIAGIAIAIGGLLKLFPFALLAAAVVPLVRSYAARGPSSAEEKATRLRSLLLLVTCAIATVALALLAPLSGRTWLDFIHKITAEFHSGINMINSVSATALLATLGVPTGSPINHVFSLLALAPLIAMFWIRPQDGETVARRGLVLFACFGWLMASWLNYYVVLPLVLVPWLARRSRVAAVLWTAFMAASYGLPAFADPALMRDPWVHALKILPYLGLPATLVALELRGARVGARVSRAAFALAVVLVVGTGVEIWRGSAVRRLTADGAAALGVGNAGLALASYDRLVRLAPGDAVAQRKRAIALASAGRMDEALAAFARAASLAPDDAAAHDDYGRALLMCGRTDDAARELDRARTLEPTDVQVLFQLAHARFEQGRRAEAVELLQRARELAPEEPAIGRTLEMVLAQ
jgi:Glycosyltransferase family 87/Tetratricopeptide repeat